MAILWVYPRPKPSAQIEIIIPQNQELLAWLGLKFCSLLINLDAFFCSHSLRILIIFVRYKINSSATEGLVQQLLQRIWAFGLMESFLEYQSGNYVTCYWNALVGMNPITSNGEMGSCWN
jgi:hypothetical protein